MARRIYSALCGILAATVLAAAPATYAQAADLVAPGPYVAMPDSQCAKAGYLSSIKGDFRHQASQVHHEPGLSIVSISNFRENRYEPLDNSLVSVERLYCQATAGTSDGQTRTLWYLIEYREGFAGVFGDNVEFCLSGLDRWNVYDGNCRVLR